MNDKITPVNFGDLLTMVSLVVGENKVGVGITVDVEQEEGEHGVMGLTPPYDGRLILGGLVVQGMKVLLEVLHGDLHRFFNSTLIFFLFDFVSYLVVVACLYFGFLSSLSFISTIEITILSLSCMNILTKYVVNAGYFGELFYIRVECWQNRTSLHIVFI